MNSVHEHRTYLVASVCPTMGKVESSQTDRRNRTSREVVRQRLLDATLRLLDDHQPDELTSRQIAQAAGEHLRYIADYFGSQIDLIAATLPAVVADALTTVSPEQAKDEPPPALVKLVRLSAWLADHRPNLFVDLNDRPVFDRVKAVYEQQYGLETEISRLLAQRTLAGIFAFVLHRPLIGAEDGDFAAHVALNHEIAIALARSPRNSDS